MARQTAALALGAGGVAVAVATRGARPATALPQAERLHERLELARAPLRVFCCRLRQRKQLDLSHNRLRALKV